jgi:hypothetical protein
MQIEAIAQVAMREGLSEEQVAYEQWVDRQPLGAVVAWDEMGDEERGMWCREILGREWKGEEMGIGEDRRALEGVGAGVEDGYARVEFRDDEGRGKEAVGDLGESRWIAVRTDHTVNEMLASGTQVVAEVGEWESALISTGMLKLHSENSCSRLQYLCNQLSSLNHH